MVGLCVFFRGIAQLVERRSPKPNVVSSNLTAPAIFFGEELKDFFNQYLNGKII